MIYTWKSYQKYAKALEQKIDSCLKRVGCDDFNTVSNDLHEAARLYTLATAVKEYALFKELERRGMAEDGEGDELDYIPSESEIAEIDSIMSRYPEVE